MKKSHIIPIGLLSTLSLISPGSDLLSALLYSEALSGYTHISDGAREHIVYAAGSATLIQRKTITYNVPGSATQVEFILGYDSAGVISSIQTNKINGDSTSTIFINLFIGKVGPAIIGKNLKSLTPLSAIGGASLTTAAFGQFLAGITLPVIPPSSPAPVRTVTPVVKPVITKTPAPTHSPTSSSSVPSTQTIISYTTPGGIAKVGFTLTRDYTGVIRTIATVPLSGDQMSFSYMLAFTRAIGGQIIGKKINDLSLIAVAGASLTTDAFKEFLMTFPQIQSSTAVAVSPIVPEKKILRPVLSPVQYKNLTYTVPGGVSTVRFAFRTDTAGKIRSIQARNVLINEPTTAGYIRAFGAQIGRLALGKKPSELDHLSAIGGASLTTGAFKKFASAMVEGKLDALTSEIIVDPATSQVILPATTNTGITQIPAQTTQQTSLQTTTQTISYTVPGSTTQVSFTLGRDPTGIIQSVTASKVTGDSTSTAYIQMFASSISAATVGRNITGLSLSAIGGASLTTGAFNQFITSIGGSTGIPVAVIPVTPTTPVVSTPITTTPVVTTSTVSPVTTSPVGSNQTAQQSIIYSVPGATAQAQFTLVYDAQGIAQSLTTTVIAGNTESRAFITSFASSITTSVVGKSISSIPTLSRVGGASLTTGAFNQFITSIRPTIAAMVTPTAGVTTTVSTSPTTPPITAPTSSTVTPTTSILPVSSPTTLTIHISNGGMFATTTASLKIGDSINFVYMGTDEAIIQFTPSTVTGLTVDRDITQRTRLFSTAGTWTAKIKDYSGNTLTIAVQ